MKDDLITWGPEPVVEDEWSLVGAVNDDETYAYNIALKKGCD